MRGNRLKTKIGKKGAMKTLPNDGSGRKSGKEEESVPMRFARTLVIRAIFLVKEDRKVNLILPGK